MCILYHSITPLYCVTVSFCNEKEISWPPLYHSELATTRDIHIPYGHLFKSQLLALEVTPGSLPAQPMGEAIGTWHTVFSTPSRGPLTGASANQDPNMACSSLGMQPEGGLHSRFSSLSLEQAVPGLPGETTLASQMLHSSCSSVR